MAQPSQIFPGAKFVHFKTGNTYIILNIATLEEDGDTLVIYARWNPNSNFVGKLWARRMSIFCANVPDTTIPSGELKDLQHPPLVERFKLWSEATTGDPTNLEKCPYREIKDDYHMCRFLSNPVVQRYAVCVHKGNYTECKHYKDIQLALKTFTSIQPPLPELKGFSIATGICEKWKQGVELCDGCTHKCF